jgi:hypothetical protein
MLAAARLPLLDVLVADRLRGRKLGEIEGRTLALHAAAALLREVADHVQRDHSHISRLAIGLSRRLRLDPILVVETIFPPDAPAETSSANPPARARDQPLPPEHTPGCSARGCDCAVWNWHARHANRSTFVRADGTLFHVGTRGWETPDVTRGHHGDHFALADHHGNVRETLDLSVVGQIPEFWRRWLPDQVRLSRTSVRAARRRFGQAQAAYFFPDPVLVGHDYAHRSPVAGLSITRVEHDPESRLTAWILATANADTPVGRRATELVAEIAAKAGVLVGAGHGLAVAREALLAQPDMASADAALTIVTASMDRPLEVASTGRDLVYAMMGGRPTVIAGVDEAVGGHRYLGAAGDEPSAVAERFLGDLDRRLGPNAHEVPSSYRLPIEARDRGARPGAIHPPPLPYGAAVRPATGLRAAASLTAVLQSCPEAVFVFNRDFAVWPQPPWLRSGHVWRDTGVPAEVVAVAGGPPARYYLDAESAQHYPPTAAAFAIRPCRPVPVNASPPSGPATHLVLARPRGTRPASSPAAPHRHSPHK